jgi:regulator of replication initiation timing
MANRTLLESGAKYAHESVRQLKKENRELQHELTAVRDTLSQETSRAETAAKAARDAWSFARTVLKTGRRVGS